jgi:predicted nuclease of restriction endonuclease-like RecB superfamily
MMLPIELLTVQRWKDQVRPKYSNLNSRDIAVAEAVIHTYSISIGLKRSEIRERISDLENAFGDYKLARGLAALVERTCTFNSRFYVDPVKARHLLFTEAARRGFPTSPEERLSIIESAASILGVSAEQVESSIYADLDAEAVLESCPEIGVKDLLRQYNLSLTQTLLFQSIEMEFTAGGNWKRIFRAVKFHGLMYRVMRWGGSIVVKIDGPTSLFKLTRRYGTALAKVVPEIMQGKPWRIHAKILRENRLLNFTLRSERHGWLFPKVQASEEYDSTVEAEFAEQFRSLGADWSIKRESEPLEAGSAIIIPDFTFRFGRLTVYMEVVGFWTREYLKRKLEKLAEVKAPLIVAVDEELACDRFARLQSSNPNISLIYFKGRVPVREVMRLLQPLAEAELKTQASEVKPLVKKPIATLKELAEEHGVAEKAIKRAAGKVETHVLIGEMLIEKRLLEDLKRTLEEAVTAETPLLKALEALKPYNIPDPLAVITSFGYKVRWRGLSTENATVYKPTHTNQ